jgi:hypothetical protein
MLEDNLLPSSVQTAEMKGFFGPGDIIERFF